MAEEKLDLGARPACDLSHHRTAFADDDLLLGLGLDQQSCAYDPVTDLLHFHRDRVRHLVLRQPESLLSHELGQLHVDRQIRPLLLREVQRALGEEPDEFREERIHPITRLGTYRMKRVKVTELRSRLHLRCDVARLQTVDLVQGNHDGNALLEHAASDEAVAGADPLPRRQHQENALDVLESRIDRPLHMLGERVKGALEARQVGEHQLVALAVRDSEDPPPRRLRLVGHDRDLPATERVHQRGLADIRPPGDGDEAGFQPGRYQVSGSNSGAEYVASSPLEFKKVISSIPNSYSHWRQPPQGEAVIPIAAMSPGR